jgi:hypothetical protein
MGASFASCILFLPPKFEHHFFRLSLQCALPRKNLGRTNTANTKRHHDHHLPHTNSLAFFLVVVVVVVVTLCSPFFLSLYRT